MRSMLIPALVLIVALFADNLPMLKPATGMAASDSSASVDGVSDIVNVTSQNEPHVFNYDVVVYGGTPSGVMTAVAASRQGLKAVILEPGRHLGGIVTSGLCNSDVENSSVIGGMAKEFFTKVGAYYNVNKPMYAFEPHVAEQVFNQFVTTADVDVFYEHRLKEPDGVSKQGSNIVSVTTADGCVFSSKIFVDSSYEGDLMAASGVSYMVGREDQKKYNESLAGIRPEVSRNNFKYNCPAFSTDGKLMPLISGMNALPAGQGDNKLPAYNFRLCMTDDPTNMVPFQKPSDYDADTYKVFVKWMYTLKQAEKDRTLRLTDILSMCSLPHRKYDVNNCGPVSTDLIGSSWAYPEGSPAQRDAIAKTHKNYLLGLLYFLSTDTRVPPEIQKEMKKWGLAKDEFEDNGNWPYELYIRESRRMIGNFVLTQQDLQYNLQKSDVIAMGAYPIDSHSVQRVMTKNGFVMNEGEIFYPVSPYLIPYRCLTPKISEATNLLVTVCVSASHVAFSSLRMEPQFMMMGQAAGNAAAIAIYQKSNVQSVNLTALQALLKAQGAVLSIKA